MQLTVSYHERTDTEDDPFFLSLFALFFRNVDFISGSAGHFILGLLNLFFFPCFGFCFLIRLTETYHR